MRWIWAAACTRRWSATRTGTLSCWSRSGARRLSPGIRHVLDGFSICTAGRGAAFDRPDGPSALRTAKRPPATGCARLEPVSAGRRPLDACRVPPARTAKNGRLEPSLWPQSASGAKLKSQIKRGIGWPPDKSWASHPPRLSASPSKGARRDARGCWMNHLYYGDNLAALDHRLRPRRNPGGIGPRTDRNLERHPDRGGLRAPALRPGTALHSAMWAR